MTTVANIRDGIPPGSVYIGRAGRGFDGYFGNPIRLRRDTPEERRRVLNEYVEYFIERVEIDPEFRMRIEGLRGKTLLCFCAPKSCHGDIIAAWLDEE